MYVFWALKENHFYPLWLMKSFGDFPPHTFSYLDLNQDGKKDLMILSGFEDVFYTEIFLQQKLDTFNLANFERVYLNDNTYSAVIDLNGDGIPQILDSGYPDDSRPETEFYDEVYGIPDFPFNDDILKSIEAEYKKIATVKGSHNFTYNMPEYVATANTFIGDPIKILGFEGRTIQDITCKFPIHLNWSIGVLREIQKEYFKCNQKENPKIQERIAYLEQKKICD